MVRKGSKTVIAGKCLSKGHPAFLTSKVHEVARRWILEHAPLRHIIAECSSE